MTELVDQDYEKDHVSEIGGANPWLDELHPSTKMNGWYQKYTECSILYLERDKKTLVVSFDNLLDAGNKKADRYPWGYKFFTKFDYSHLGIMVNAGNWFRDQDIIDALEGLKKQGFFDKFETVAFAGTSMGGFAALAFSRLVPGCNVIAYSPQTTLDKRLAPWETRFGGGQAQNWDLDYSDASQGLETANKISIVYDPLSKLDKMQVDRIPDLPNVQRLLLPACGHKTPVILKRINSLAYVQKAGVEGDLDPAEFRKRARGRRHLIMYRGEMMGRIERKYGKEMAERWAQGFKLRKRKHQRYLNWLEKKNQPKG